MSPTRANRAEEYEMEDPAKSTKRKFLKVPRELVDGEHYTYLDPLEAGDWLHESVRLWMAEEEPCVGDRLTLEVVEMSREEFEALPEI